MQKKCRIISARIYVLRSCLKRFSRVGDKTNEVLSSECSSTLTPQEALLASQNNYSWRNAGDCSSFLKMLALVQIKCFPAKYSKRTEEATNCICLAQLHQRVYINECNTGNVLYSSGINTKYLE